MLARHSVSGTSVCILSCFELLPSLDLKCLPKPALASLQIGDELTSAVQTALAASGFPAVSHTTAGVTDSSEQRHINRTKSTLHQKQQTQVHTDSLTKASADDAHETTAAAAAAGAVLKQVGQPERAVKVQKPVSMKAVKPFHPSGDDLGDEFDVEPEAAEDAGTKMKKKKAFSSTESDLHPGNLGNSVTSKKARKSKHKVVSF